MNLSHSMFIDHVMEMLSEKFGTPIILKNSRLLSGGCINRASLLETTAGIFFLKWNNDCPQDLFVSEAESLDELRKAASPTLVIPEVILAAETGELPGFLVLEYLSSERSRNADEELGRGLASLHRFSGEFFGFHRLNYCGSTPQDNSWNKDWCYFFVHQRIARLVDLLRVKGYFSSPEVRIFDQLIQKIPAILGSEGKPVLIHGDLWAGNYMNTIKGPALIDPAVYYADREMEFGIMTLFGGFTGRFWAAYDEINPLPEGWHERNRLYQLYHILNHCLIFGGGYGRQALEIAKYYL
jgi:protein-ribulosamine 3-kinase